VLRVDGKELALETGCQDVLEDDVADGVLTVGSADDGYRVGLEKRGQIVLFQHGKPLVGRLWCDAAW
jgi:hypothetical protein